MLTLWNDAAQLQAIDDGMVEKSKCQTLKKHNQKKRLDKSEKRNDRWTKKSDAISQANHDFGSFAYKRSVFDLLVDSNVTIMSLQFKQAQSN